MTTGRRSRAGLALSHFAPISKSLRIEIEIILARIPFHFGRKSISFQVKTHEFFDAFLQFCAYIQAKTQKWTRLTLERKWNHFERKMKSFRSKYLIISQKKPLHFNFLGASKWSFFRPKQRKWTWNILTKNETNEKEDALTTRASGTLQWPQELDFGLQNSCASIQSYAPGCARLLRSGPELRC